MLFANLLALGSLHPLNIDTPGDGVETSTKARLGGEFYCPQGHKFSSPSKHFDDDFIAAFENNCQCECCKYGEMKNHTAGCSTVFGAVLEDNYNGKVACVLHDYCYLTSGRTQEDCDREFNENLQIVCDEPDEDILPSCDTAIDIAVYLVEKFGEDHFDPYEKCPKDCDCRQGLVQPK